MRIVWQAAEKFAADDGWAIASYIGLTLLTSLFPFLIFVAALAGFLGSQRAGARSGQARLRRVAGRCGPPDRRRSRAGPDDPAQRRIAHFRRGLLVLFRLQRHRSASGRPQSRLWPCRAEALVDAAAPVAGARADRLGCAARARLPRRARAADCGHAGGLLSVGGAGAQPAHVPPHRDRGLDAGDLADSCASHPAGPPARVSRHPAGRRR